MTSERSKIFRIGFIFLLVGLVINYIYRLVYHQIPIEKVILGSDMEGYYQYLVHFFIRDWELFDRMPWTLSYGEGKTLSVFTSGLAILWSPFFLIAHFISIFLGLDSDGYANLYFGFILVAGIVYTYVGLVFIYKFLCEFFDRKTSLITASLFFLTTNVFFYSVLLGSGMSHVYSFAMISVYLYYCVQFSKNKSTKNLILLGIPFAIAVLIRPTNIISGLFLFLYGVNSWESFKEKVLFWLRNYRAIILLFVIGVVVFIPQMAYWHYVTGKFLFYSYQEYGFPNWMSPKIGVVLFGKYNGWFTYTPIVLFGMAGLVVLLRKKIHNGLAILIILSIIVYVNASWWVPTFSSACGQRAMIDFLPFIALPLALMVSKYDSWPARVKTLVFVLVLVFVFYNIQFGFRYNAGLWWDSPMSWSKFWSTLKF